MEEKRLILEKNKFFYKKCIFFAFIFLISIFVNALFADTSKAATIYLYPSTGAHEVGKTFSVNINVSSSDQAMNAVSGILSFPVDMLELLSLSKTGSVVSLWVQEPSFSNTLGSVSLEGIILNPGFTGASGKVITLNFKAKSAGTASVRFSSGSVLANDGEGTNILTGLGNASFDLGIVEPKVTKPSSKPAPVVRKLPDLPQVSSPTHPDLERWYNTNAVDFEWVITKDITGVNILRDQKPDTNPGTRSDGKITSYSYTDVEDGEWFFHTRLRNSSGWGPVGHFQFNIDTEDPESFNIRKVEREDLTNPTTKFLFIAEDKTSGIDHFEIKIDDEGFQMLPAGVSEYETSVLGPGNHTLFVKALDGAGNFLTDSIKFVVDVLEPPVITSYTEFLEAGEDMIIKGKAVPEAKVNIWMQRNKDQMIKFEVKSDSDGDFIFIYDEKLKDGFYMVWAEAVNEWGSKSEFSEPVTIVVRPSDFLRLSSLTITLLSIAVPVLSLLILLILIIWYLWNKFRKFRNVLKKEVDQTENSVHLAFEKLRADIRRQICILEKARIKRQLTKEEVSLVRQMKKDLDDAEKIIDKNLKDIGKKLQMVKSEEKTKIK